jgi:hypothetical protein
MRKFILIASMVLASAAAHAGERGLTLAANDGPAAATAQPAADPAPADAPKAVDTPKYVERPAAVDTSPPATQPKADVAGKPSRAQIAKAKHKHDWTEARIVGELHRHGVYW